jgi:hypothetical protein
MSTIAGVGNGLQAALLLARGRPEGIALLTAREEPVQAVAARSFWAAALCLPAFICLQLIDQSQAGQPPFAAHGFALQLLGYAIGWTGFALVSHGIAAGMGRAAAWPRFIAAWNWCNVVQYLLLVAASLPPLLGLPALIGDTAWLVTSGWALWLEWYATRLALGVTGLQAFGLVALDEAMGVVILAVIQIINGP